MTPPSDQVYPEGHKKICTKCGQSKSLDDFHKNKNLLHGRAATCKQCRNVTKVYGPKFRAPNKICSKCKISKSSDQFRSRGEHGTQHRLRSWCIQCEKEANSANYQKNKEQEKQRHREYRIHNRAYILAREQKLRDANKERMNEASRIWATNNPDRIIERRRRFNEKNPTYYRDLYKKKVLANASLVREEKTAAHFRRLGVDQDWYDETLALQGFGCAICGNPESGVKGKRFHIDHDHSCCGTARACSKCRRGLLCMHCNTWISKFERFPLLARTAIAYLNKYREALDNSKPVSQQRRELISTIPVEVTGA